MISYNIFFPALDWENVGITIAFITELPQLIIFVINNYPISSPVGIGDSSSTLSPKPDSAKPTKSFLSMEAPDDNDADVEDIEMDSDYSDVDMWSDHSDADVTDNNNSNLTNSNPSNPNPNTSNPNPTNSNSNNSNS